MPGLINRVMYSIMALLLGFVNTGEKLSLTFGVQVTNAKEMNACQCFRKCGADSDGTPKIETVRSVRGGKVWLQLAIRLKLIKVANKRAGCVN